MLGLKLLPFRGNHGGKKNFIGSARRASVSLDCAPESRGLQARSRSHGTESLRPKRLHCHL